tara:strand:- start:12309 stop:13460 length:1152 start_codon:yes stop_codon:yes gene_type:complete
MREGQCAEMLRSVLVACPSLAAGVFKWLAHMTGVPIALIDELDWSLETEQSIGSKRDDLRIEGWRAVDDDQQRAALWTVEIKVAAPLHESAQQDWESGSDITPVDDPENVNQLLNYDSWLAHQDADHKAGFVLALRDMSMALPDGLGQTWRCFTWTTLAMEVERALAADQLPTAEQPFAEHMLGFIRHRLWDTTDMTTSRLELDDVALLRALAAIGPSCSRKLRDLVNDFEVIFRDVGISFVQVKSSTQTSFFDRSDVAQCWLTGFLIRDSRGELTVSAGIMADDLCVRVTTYPRGCSVNTPTHQIVSRHKTELLKRNPDWVLGELDGVSPLQMSLSKPLVSVLGDEDWQSPLRDFVSGALTDLKEAGVLDAFINIEVEKNES